MPQFRDIEKEVGDVYKVMGVFDDKFQVKNQGVVAWAWDPHPFVLACWRVAEREDKRRDVEFCFFHPRCVDPLGEFYDEVEEGSGEAVSLPVEFESFLRKIIDAYPDLENSQVQVEYIEETLGWMVTCNGKGTRGVEFFAPHFVETVNANAPRHLPPYL